MTTGTDAMNFREVVLKNRSYRRFDEDERIDPEVLKGWVDLARICPNAANQQPLKYFATGDLKVCDRIFPHLKWAAALPDWDGPEEGERPAAYVVIFLDHHVSQSSGCDHGIAAQTILLAATVAGFGGCMLGAVDRHGLAETLGVPPHLEILLVVALGRPAETVRLVPVGEDRSLVYYRDDEGVHHVPKRSLKEVMIRLPWEGTEKY